MADLATAQALMTAEEFAALPDDGRRLALVAGEVVDMGGSGGRHTVLAQLIMGHLMVWAVSHGRGMVGGADAGCLISRDPDTVLVPDGVWWPQFASVAETPATFVEQTPGLVLEVVAPSDRRADVFAKVAMWLQAGVTVVWVVWPESRTLEIWRDDRPIETLCATDTLTCDDLLPGFELPLETVLRVM